MPRIYDNIEEYLVDGLRETLRVSYRADFCVGYFNLRGWRQIEGLMEEWQGGADGCCRLMIGMQEKPQDELRHEFRFKSDGEDEDDSISMDRSTSIRLKNRVAQDFRDQLTVGAPTNADQKGLQRLSTYLKSGRVAVKLYLRHKLHAKLYLLHRHDKQVPIIGYMGSSNLTFAGLSRQGELNIDVVEQDACLKLNRWFDEQWEDRWCLDISEELATIIDESWAREEPISPYLIYLKMAYHLSQEARAGLLEYSIPKDIKQHLFAYQEAAVQIAARHLNKRGGVLIGDVVGLGKTLMATALARVMQEDQAMNTLIICPKNLEKMWEDYQQEYSLTGMVMPSSVVIKELPNLRRYRLVIVDESHNMRNPESKRFHAIKEYIAKNDSKCILLTATPYNKNFRDISAQLRLFLSEDKAKDMGIRPEKLLSEMTEPGFMQKYQFSVRSLAAFEESTHAEDWHDLMRLYMVRRTRSFIQENYATLDKVTGRRYLTFRDGGRSYFPVRVPRTVKFTLDEGRSDDQYARLYAENVLATINKLSLPRYGLANYLVSDSKQKSLAPTSSEKQSIKNLSRAGKRLMGFCRTGLFKRLESGGPAFIQSLERHTLRNFIFLHALENGLDVPIGSQNAELLDATTDQDESIADQSAMEEEEATGAVAIEALPLATEAEYRKKAAEVYNDYTTKFRSRFKWIRPIFFNSNLAKALLADSRGLLDVLAQCSSWDAHKDAKLGALYDLITRQHPHEKVLIFTQFADTVAYLTQQLKVRGITALEGVTGNSADPTDLAWRFSPISNGKSNTIGEDKELRVLVATDVLSEGQNLQDAAIVVNYDLPWAIIRLIQRAGRVDRIGQLSDTIYCYSFLPADGVEQLIRLRERVRLRLQENAEVVGTDESFFEDDGQNAPLRDLYNEKAGILDGDGDAEVDLTSQAYQIWKNATDARPELKPMVEKLPNVVFSTRAHQQSPTAPQGVLIYMRTNEGNDSLAWINRKGESVTQSQLAILTAARCDYNTPALVPLPDEQHDLVRQGVEQILTEDRSTSGQLGRPSGARYRGYERLKHFVTQQRKLLIRDFELLDELDRAVSDIYDRPLTKSATDAINRQIRNGIEDKQLAELVLNFHQDDRLCLSRDEADEGRHEAQILCSLGLFEDEE